MTHPISLEPHLGPTIWRDEEKLWQRWRKVSLAQFLAWSPLLWWTESQHAMASSSTSQWCHEKCPALPFAQGDNVQTALEVLMMTAAWASPIHHSIPSKYTKEQPWWTPWGSQDLKQGQNGTQKAMRYRGTGILLFWIQFWFWTFSESACFSSMSNKNSKISYTSICIFIYIFILSICTKVHICMYI